jgi:vacuolar protein sorting-associated protein 18
MLHWCMRLNCITLQVLPHLTARKQASVTELQRKLSRGADRNGFSGTVTQAAQTQSGSDVSLKEQLDDIVASECVYCGDAMIRLDSNLL